MARVTVKERLLQVFHENPGVYFSGEQLAGKLSCTRAAVWKAVEALRKEGYLIDGTTNRGYTVREAGDALSAQLIMSHLTEEAAHVFRAETRKCTESTNNDVRARGNSGEPEGLVIAAEEQTKGRGRQGRSFFSPENTGLYFSVLLRPELPAQDAVLITAAAAVCISKACEKVCPGLSEGDLEIKWVNDLYLHGKKVCGILTEGMLSMESGTLEQAIVGIGVNLYTPEGGWPEEIQSVAGSILGEASEHRGSGLRSLVVAEFLNAFLPVYRKLSERAFIPEYEKRQLVIGKQIEVMTGEEPWPTAVAVGVDRDCHLLVHMDGDSEQELRALNSGEVRIRPIRKDE